MEILPSKVDDSSKDIRLTKFSKELTYTSTHELIRALVNVRKLIPYRPKLLVRGRFKPVVRGPMKRRAFLTPAAQNDLENTNSAVWILGGEAAIGSIHNALTRWVTGGRVYKSHDTHFLKDLTPPPPEIWEIRVTEPQPQFRIFGRFLEQDTFIVTNMHSRSFLGKKGSAEWGEAMATCETQWKSLPCMPDPMAENEISKYVGEEFDDFPIKRY
ncbi:hypothetical protein KTQ54_06330 [Komagataeibacter oboediens]|uniref:hypothetical protein n=1 Tax=Komagataeibacter oboediens TaxID=65958 RepID=UPI001C2C2BD0|nr:hypothetical protein [Komagataeibacter oboediens]MBV0888154.1 hypothetical protein [Komagataeibacter oboediens]MCK9820744.1 hypothetical protein [Komagataeibacter oboediens]